VAEDLHAFITGTLWAKLKADVQNLLASNRPELVASAYFHARRFLLIQPGWTCRVGSGNDHPDLLLHSQGTFRAALRFEFVPDQPTFPFELLDARMNMLLRTAADLGRSRPGRAYLLGVFDSAEPALYPDEPDQEAQTCFWLPVNCRDFPNHAEWRSRLERLTAAQ
jgi:hypothetical protein